MGVFFDRIQMYVHIIIFDRVIIFEMCGGVPNFIKTFEYRTRIVYIFH